MKKILDKGAEATIFLDKNTVTKTREEKLYRLKQIDDKLRKFRTRRESKVLNKLQEIDFPAPKVKDMCDKAMELRMEMVQGNKLRDVLYKDPLGLGREIGRKIGILHANDIIHGDLTTSNMILDDEIKFIDFGLSFFSHKEEDKAVDLHLLRRALESKHHEKWEDIFKQALEGYRESYPEHELVLNRLKSVEKRGRHKGKI
jgi:TP53 regulating kinase-like protein